MSLASAIPFPWWRSTPPDAFGPGGRGWSLRPPEGSSALAGYYLRGHSHEIWPQWVTLLVYDRTGFPGSMDRRLGLGVIPIQPPYGYPPGSVRLPPCEVPPVAAFPVNLPSHAAEAFALTVVDHCTSGGVLYGSTESWKSLVAHVVAVVAEGEARRVARPRSNR